jgi:Sigma-70 region 2
MRCIQPLERGCRSLDHGLDDRDDRRPVTTGRLRRIRDMATPERSDARLLASGRPSDFGAFYDRHLAAVTSYVGGRVRQPEVIFDLVAETFARALENRTPYDAQRGPVIAWLLGIARNLILDSFRRGQVEAPAVSGWG